MFELLFATTNHSKTAQLKELLKNKPIKLLELADLDFEIKEPVEEGLDAVEIAKNKASYYFQAIKGKYNILAQDDSVEFIDVAAKDNPGTEIKAPVIAKYGELTIKNTIKYYSELSKKYNGEIKFNMVTGFALVQKNKVITTSKAEIPALLVDTPKQIDLSSKYPLKFLAKVNIDGVYKYAVDLTPSEGFYIRKPILNAVLQLINPLISEHS